jgi:hypothetical protein
VIGTILAGWRLGRLGLRLLGLYSSSVLTRRYI